ncbi:hypothetical protein OROMI_024958 [Orobanche minor]
MFFKIRPSQEILKIRDDAISRNFKIRDGTPFEAEEMLTYIKEHSKQIGLPSQEILKIRDGTPLEAEGILTYIKSPRNGSICYFSSKLDVPSNVVQKKRVARILFFKIRPSQEILKIRDATPLEVEGILTYIKSPRNGSILILKNRDGTPLEAEEILTYIKSLQNGLVCYFSSKLDVPSNVLQKKRVARILFFKIRPSQEILKIRDGTPFEAEEILTYIKEHSKQIGLPSQEILKIRDGTPLEAEEILTYIKKPSKRIEPSQEILKIRDGTPLEAEEILTYIKKPSKRIVQKKRVARIMFFKIRRFQEILKIRDGTPLEAEGILTYIKSPRNGSICYFSNKLDVPSNAVHNKRVARILFFKIRQSQEILKIRDGTPLEAEGILTYIKSPRNGSICYFSSKLDVPSNVVQKKRVAQLHFFKIRPSQEILKIRDATPLEAEGILTYIKSPQNGSICYFSSKLDVPSNYKLDVPSNIVQKKRVARIMFFKIRPSQEILKIRDGTPLEAEGILTYIKSPRNGSICYFSSKLDVPSNVVQKKRVARILFFKIRPSQEILKIRDATPLEVEGILTYIKSPRNGSICYFSSKLDMPSQVILKNRDGTPLEAEEILTYIKSLQNGLVCYFSSKLDVPSNVLQKKIVARILFFKIRPSQEILKIRDGTPFEAEEILTYIKEHSKQIGLPSQEILKIRDGTPLEAEEILTYIKKPSKRIVQKKRVARIMFFKSRPFQEILKIRDGTPLEAEGILTYIKSPRNGSICYFSSKLDVPSNAVHNKRVARILFFKIRQSQEILKIRDGTPLEAEGILTYIKALETDRFVTFLAS